MLSQIAQIEISQSWELIRKSSRIGIVSHRGPDADTVGTNLALRLVLQPLGKIVDSICIDSLPANCRFLPQANNFIQEFNYNDYDLFIIVDCGASYMTAFHEKKPELLSNKVPIINIDHHESNDNFGVYNLVQTNAASTTFILWHLFKKWNLTITPHIATCLYAGLSFDTGSFQHDNTTPDVMRCAADLVRHNANVSLISYHLFKENSVNKLKLWGKIFNRARVNHKQIISSAITARDFQESGASKKDTEGAIDYLTAVKNSKFAIMLSEDMNGNIKGSLRTQGETDVAKIASLLGGGGHKKAAGFSMPGELKEEIEWLVS